jgi:carbamoyl-phosphate synthase large subunit
MEGTVFISVREVDKAGMIEVAKELHDLGFKICATRGTAREIEANNIPVDVVNKVNEGLRPHCVDKLISDEIQLVINTSEGAQSIKDSYEIRRTSLTRNVPHYTTLAGAKAAVAGIGAMKRGDWTVTSLQQYFAAE